MEPPAGSPSCPSIFRSLFKLRVKSHTAIQMFLEQRDYVLGIVLLLIVVFLWTASNFVTQDIFEDGFHKPFLVTYLNTSSFLLYLIPYAFKRRVEGQRGYEAVGLVHTPPAGEGLPPLTVRETRELAFVFCFLWFVANWSLNAALDYTSVASATILSSMSGLSTLSVGRVFHVETLTFVKVIAVFLSFAGVVLVSLSDSSSTLESKPTNLLWGDFLALVSAIVYGLYVTLLKVRIHFESRIDMQLFFGFVGLYNVLTCWVVGVVLHILGIESFGLPTSSVSIKAIIFNMFITLSSDYLYVIAMLKTTPLVVTIGLSLTIPLAVIGDLLFGKTVHFLVLIGALIVVFSFIMVGLDDARIRSVKLDDHDTSMGVDPLI
ncbi:hypothetical protein H2248_000733 [Termitomyces sp. 'cryptogamus']|nr:hypothetical protein H2248_000733 [Termitomyces sp. 'cryptogamus']